MIKHSLRLRANGTPYWKPEEKLPLKSKKSKSKAKKSRVKRTSKRRTSKRTKRRTKVQRGGNGS